MADNRGNLKRSEVRVRNFLAKIREKIILLTPFLISWFPLQWKLDVDPQRDDDASPMSTYRCMLKPTWMISALQHKSKYKSNSISNFKKYQFFWFPCCSTCEDLSVDVSITYVGLILTKPGRFFFSAYGNSGYGQNSISSISNFLKIFHISGFPWCSTREELSIDVSITNVRLILTKLYDDIFSRGADRRTDRQTDRQTDGQTDTVLESSHGNMSAHKKFQLKAQN